MSVPVPILPDRCRHEIRNTHGKLAVFQPHPLIRAAFMFILATAARRYNIGIVAYAMMPTHIHIVVRPQLDPTKPYDLVEFRKFVRSNMALFVNSYWDLKGARFCRDSVGDSIKILDEASELDQLLYVELNGVSAGLGRRPEELDGAISQRKWLTKAREIERPEFWFQKRTWNETESLQLCVPKLLSHQYSPTEFEKWSMDLLEQRLRRVRKERRKAGLQSKTLFELERITPDFSQPEHSSADHSRAQMVGEDKLEKAREFHNIRAFVRWHADALQRQRDGEENVVFPPGTYKAARYGARVAEPNRFVAPIRRRDECELGRLYERQIQNDHQRLIQRE